VDVIRRIVPTIVLTTSVVLLVLGLKISQQKPASEQATIVQTSMVGTQTRRVIDGPPIPAAHGIVQVRVTLVGSRITAITVVNLPHDNNYSWLDSRDAAPILGQEAIDKQSAEIDAVSGATYTSQAYKTSLQAALDMVRTSS
jgi:uncharacterized protein with FMN-binding domain